MRQRGGREEGEEEGGKRGMRGWAEGGVRGVTDAKLHIKKKYYKHEKPSPNKEVDTLIVLFDLYNQDSVDLKISKISPNLEKTFIERFPNKKIFNFILEYHVIHYFNLLFKIKVSIRPSVALRI